jgi:hypothetical protein
MSNSNQMVWVIRNRDGYFVNADFRALFNGRTTGFVGYTNKDRMQKDLDKLGELGEGYYSEQVCLNEIPKGVRIYT